MKHFTLPRFWDHYHELPEGIQDLADRKFELLKSNPRHPSLHLKKIGNQKQLIIEHWDEKNPRASFGFGSAPTPSTTNSSLEC